MRNRVLIALALVATVVVVPASAAHAQCSPPLTVAESLSNAEVAFVGKVVDRSNRDRTAVMEVLEVWKGHRLPARVTVNGGPEDLAQHTAIDRTFLLGQIYLVMPANARAPFQDSMCSGTQLWSTPTGSIPAELQQAAGRDTPLETLADGLAADDGGGGLSGSLGNIGVGLVVLALALGLIFGFRRLSSPRRRASSAPTRPPASAHVPVSPATLRSRKRRAPRLSMPSLFVSKRGSRLEQVRKAARRGRKGPGEHEKEQLERAVKPTATRPPSRRNHYTSGRRSAP